MLYPNAEPASWVCFPQNLNSANDRAIQHPKKERTNGRSFI
jgi:hypothetical protein